MPAAKESSLHAADHQFGTERRNGVAKAPLVDIIDIRDDPAEIDLKADVLSMFNPASGPRKLPTLLLYDERGLQLYEDITYLDVYYLVNDEIDVLYKMAAEFAAKTPAGSMLIELGSGNLRKVCILLQAFEDAGKPVDYYALDLSEGELERTLAQVPPFKHVSCHGLHGTYDDGREWLKQSSLSGRPKCIFSLGSSIGNFHRDEAAGFLEGFADILGPGDSLLLGVDSCSNGEKIYHAYNDDEGVTHRFILNGLTHINKIFGEEVFDASEWKVIGEFVYDEEGGRHQAFVSPIQDVTVLGSSIQAGERIQIEQSLKYSKGGMENLWRRAGLRVTDSWMRGEEYGLHLLTKSKTSFSLDPALYAGRPLPTLEDWEALWAVWDIVTRGMLPPEELNEKPIKLRNACIFYLGHIPAFLDIQLTKTTKTAPTEPASYYSIFERGIDPDVDNPENCHDHSEIPDEWPAVEEIIGYQGRVRSRLRGLYAQGLEQIPRAVGRAVWVGFEHELMHLETLLYMMLQSDKVLPPPHMERPDFVKLAKAAYEASVDNEWFDVPAQTVTLGMDDPEDGDDPDCQFGWDNEKPARKEKAPAFQAKGRPITNEEYARYLYSKNIDQMPASWVTYDAVNGIANGNDQDPIPAVNGHGPSSDLPEEFLRGKAVRTLYGPVPLRLALDWPVFASYDDLAGCAKWMGGRIPSLIETRSIYTYAELQKKAAAQSKLSNKVPAVNAHLVNDGVEETPPSRGNVSVEDSSSQLFIDLAGANVGFKNWHPMPVTGAGRRLGGQGEMGGVWEWTSSQLAKHKGFEPMELYPAYTADFFDSKHNVVLGGSWATHPRIAGRKSFVNWYQRNYPYVWAGARLVRDVQ